MPNPAREILYANDDQSIFILDIPASIEEAQLQHHTHPQTLSSHDSQAQAQSRILASPPLREPWPSTEPKSAQARRNILSHQTSDGKTGIDVEELAKAVERALHAVKNVLGSASRATRKEEGKETDRAAWCLQRLVATEVEEADGRDRGEYAVKRRRIEQPPSPACSDLAVHKRRAYAEPLHVVRSLQGGRDHGIVVTLDVEENEDREGLLDANPTLTKSHEYPTRMQFNEGWDCSFINTTNRPLHLTATAPFLTSEGNAREQATFTIPPHTTFLKSDIFRPGALHLIAAAHLSQFSHRPQTPTPTSHATSATSSNFDIILLDPPWPNRSVRRTKHAHSHPTSANLYASNPPRSLVDLTTNLRALPINDLLSDDRLIGVWITNRSAVRDAVLDDGDSLFETWDLEVVEEWIWVKTTAHGEPVTPLRGVWRHPWEILLLGRKRTAGCEDVRESVRSVMRRFVFAAPDAHSRKPNLRSLFTLLWPNLAPIPDARGIEAEQSAKLIGLELFARCLTAGWCCVGDEVLRFQEASWWSTPPPS